MGNLSPELTTLQQFWWIDETWLPNLLGYLNEFIHDSWIISSLLVCVGVCTNDWTISFDILVKSANTMLSCKILSSWNTYIPTCRILLFNQFRLIKNTSAYLETVSRRSIASVICIAIQTLLEFPNPSATVLSFAQNSIVSTFNLLGVHAWSLGDILKFMTNFTFQLCSARGYTFIHIYTSLLSLCRILSHLTLWLFSDVTGAVLHGSVTSSRWSTSWLCTTADTFKQICFAASGVTCSK